MEQIIVTNEDLEDVNLLAVIISQAMKESDQIVLIKG